MIQGQFNKKYFSFTNISLVFSGITFLVLFFLIKFNDPSATLEVYFFLFFGVLVLLFALYSILNNHKAYIKMDSKHIEAKYGLNKKINIPISDIEFSFGVQNPYNKDISSFTLLLKNNKRYTITHLLNPEELSYFINKNITSTKQNSLDIQTKELQNVKSQRKEELIITCIGLCCMFLSIFVTVFITDSKELYEFNNSDWLYFSIFCIVETILVITVFYFAIKAGNKLLLIEYNQYKIRKIIIEQTPAINGNIYNIYTDAIYSARLTIFGFPHSESIYYSLENFDNDLRLYLYETSQVYNSKDELPFNQQDLEDLINITHLFK